MIYIYPTANGIRTHLSTRQLYEIQIQAAVGSKIVARETCVHINVVSIARSRRRFLGCCPSLRFNAYIFSTLLAESKRSASKSRPNAYVNSCLFMSHLSYIIFPDGLVC